MPDDDQSRASQIVLDDILCKIPQIGDMMLFIWQGAVLNNRNWVICRFMFKQLCLNIFNFRHSHQNDNSGS